VRNFFLHELNDEGLLVIKHALGKDNEVDIYTKNVSAPIFNKHVSKLVGNNEYLSAQHQAWECVRV
jgi:hypothetical protein